MEVTSIILRLTHVFFGVFWAGTIFFMTAFLLPAVRRAGPQGGKVMQEIALGRFVVAMPVMALLTILSGLTLLYRTSGEFNAGFMGSPPGIVLSTGGLVAIIAFIIGVAIQRPASMKMAALQAEIQAGGAPPTAEQAAQLGALQRKAMSSLHWVAGLLAVTVVCMAIWRYV